MIKKGHYDTKEIAESFVEWMKSKPVDIGNTTRLGILRYLKKGELYAKHDEYSAGNGGLMRVIPIVIHGKSDIDGIIERSIDQSKITHNNPLSDLSIEIYCKVLNLLLNSGKKLDALDVVSHFIRKNPIFSFSRYRGENSGYVVDTIKSIFHFYFDGDSFEDTIINVVNNGGDADTIAALTGALAGTTYGLESIPKKWIKKMNKNVLDDIHKQTRFLVDLSP